MTDMRGATFLMVTACLVLVAGCDVDEGGLDHNALFGAGEVHFRPGGVIWLNTSEIGSLTFSQIDLDGHVLDGVKLTGVYLQVDNAWVKLDSVKVSNGALRGSRGATQYTGAQLVGSRWNLQPVGGPPVEMRITAYTQISERESRYTFTYTEDGVEVSVCAPDQGGDTSAIPIKDIVVNADTGAVSRRAKTLFLGCLSGAVGKAYAWGYDPQTSGIANFETAIRVVRADYCYDGTSWTMPGTGIQVDDPWDGAFMYDDYDDEAIWTTSGLACLTRPRNPTVEQGQVICNGVPKPICPEDVGLGTYPGAVFWTKVAVP